MKYIITFLCIKQTGVAPFVGAWIEIVAGSPTIVIVDGSLPSWERGLKSTTTTIGAPVYIVAPFVGAWIEILGTILGTESMPSLPSWERGLKFKYFSARSFLPCRSLRGSVD